MTEVVNNHLIRRAQLASAMTYALQLTYPDSATKQATLQSLAEEMDDLSEKINRGLGPVIAAIKREMEQTKNWLTDGQPRASIQHETTGP